MNRNFTSFIKRETISCTVLTHKPNTKPSPFPLINHRSLTSTSATDTDTYHDTKHSYLPATPPPLPPSSSFHLPSSPHVSSYTPRCFSKALKPPLKTSPSSSLRLLHTHQPKHIRKKAPNIQTQLNYVHFLVRK